MELSERCIQLLEKEGFSAVYEEQQSAGLVFELLNGAGLLSVIVTEGSLMVSLNDKTKELLPGDRFDVPLHSPQSVTAGPAGCQYVIGEK